MDNREIKIFYSWQSDLPNSTTRGLIQSSIDAAVKGLRDTIAIEADRDTQGAYGSPDIVQTIFSKIDECDVFVADVSCVSVYNPLDKDCNSTNRLKATPNPNVLLELGYAAHVVSWDNVICIMNDDYNHGGELPFDIEHHRLTRYTLMGKEKADVRKELRDIISSTVLNLIENGKRVKPQFSHIQIGSFVSDSARINKVLIPWDVYKAPSIHFALETLLDSCKILIEDIEGISVTHVEESTETVSSSDKKERQDIIVTSDGKTLLPLSAEYRLDIFKARDVKIQDEDKEEIRRKTKKYFNKELLDEFFEFGGLKKRPTMGIDYSYELEGTPEEKEKYDKYVELDGTIAQMELREMYQKSFDGLLIFPLAIKNESVVPDKNIRIAIQVNPDTAEVVYPTADIINSELSGLEGMIYEEGLIKMTILMDDTTDIKYDTDLSFTLEDIQSQARAVIHGGINGVPRYGKEDYERELSKYIATPIQSSKTDFVFEISTLHAKETKWLGAAIVVKPKKAKIEMTYSVKSHSSDGNLTGKLEYNLE